MICKEMGLSSKEKILREIWELRLSTFGWDGWVGNTLNTLSSHHQLMDWERKQYKLGIALCEQLSIIFYSQSFGELLKLFS
jgi:hypothetical protein